MNSYIQKEINRQYLKMTRPKANFRLPDLKAYYSVRNDLDYYRYNDAVMADLIRLNLKYFDEERRMNRYLLFSQTVRFIWDYLPHPDSFSRRSIRVFQKTPSTEVVKLCFELFQRVSTDQYDMLFRSQGSSNFWNLAEILMRVPLNDDQIDWILAHALTNERVEFPDFEQGRKLLQENIEMYTCKYNLWALAESRLPNAEKFKRMKKHYRDDLIFTKIHIAKTKKIPAMLKWRMLK